LRRAGKEIRHLQKQVRLLEDQRDKLLALEEDLMKRISEYESRRFSSADIGVMTDAPTPEPRYTPAHAPMPAVSLKKLGTPRLCGLGMRVTEEAPHRIVELIAGGAARESHKLIVGDHILKIAGKETKFLTMSQVRDLIVGPPESIVTMKIIRRMHDAEDHDKEETFDVELVRAEIKKSDRSVCCVMLSDT